MTTRHNILLGIPGRPIEFGCALGFAQASRDHHIELGHSKGSWDNFNTILAKALTLAKRGEITHMAQLHADVAPSAWWLDVLVREMEAAGALYISATCSIKTHHGILNCAVGNRWHDPWQGPQQRFTVWETMHELPATFTGADYGCPGQALLHNNGCILADLRDPRWYTKQGDDSLVVCYDFPKKIKWDEQKQEYRVHGISEDWNMGWHLHELGIPSVITSAVQTEHGGENLYPNFGDWGTMKHDERAIELEKAA